MRKKRTAAESAEESPAPKRRSRLRYLGAIGLVIGLVKKFRQRKGTVADPT